MLVTMTVGLAVTATVDKLDVAVILFSVLYEGYVIILNIIMQTG